MKTIQLTQGKVSLVDDFNYNELIKYKWCAINKKGRWYAVRRGPNNSLLYMHHYVLPLEPGKEIDHIDGNSLNNQLSNLRLVTRSENAMNRRPHAGTLTGLKGVCWSNSNKLNPWVAKIGVDGVRHHLGYFRTKEEAALAYNKAALELFGNNAFLNALVP